jgi:GPH family glycoside/pentoside/hexuronide:cation symporter
MTQTKKEGMLSGKAFDSRIKSANTQNSERWLGYFAGPALVYVTYYCIAGSYLTQFYTDVLGLTGIFITMMPLISKVIDALTNILMGRIIDKTQSRQGKARPWLLISGPAMAVAGILLYAVPTASSTVQIVWVVFSYNLFFAFAFTLYNMSHTLMVPLSTRNTKQRDTLAMLTSTGAAMIPGMLVTIVMPIMIKAFLGVGADSQANWLKMMSILSIIALPACLIEYYFTKERVTEETMAAGGMNNTDTQVAFGTQAKACFSNKYWLYIMGLTVVYEICNNLSTNTILYYSNWVLGNSIDSGAANQVMVNMIGQAPLGIGIFILWPLVRKFGKRKVMMVGYAIGALGCIMVILSPKNMGVVLGGLAIKSIGALPTYVMMAMVAEALDHVEWVNKFRADGFTASVKSIIITVAAGVGQTIILGGISAFGYISPANNAQVIEQPGAMQTFFLICFVGAPMLAYLVGTVFMIFYDVEKLIPKIAADITARHKAEAEARGEVYYSTEEKAAMERAENDRLAEERRIEELKEKCAKKGLDFDLEEAKYQQKMAAKKAKEDAKKKK